MVDSIDSKMKNKTSLWQQYADGTFLLFEVVGVFCHPKRRLDFDFIVTQKILQMEQQQHFIMFLYHITHHTFMNALSYLNLSCIFIERTKESIC